MQNKPTKAVLDQPMDRPGRGTAQHDRDCHGGHDDS
jgi:hypothetical protein